MSYLKQCRWIGIFAIAVLGIFTLTPTPVHAQPPGNWLSIEDEHFIVYYREGFKSDAEMILRLANLGWNVTRRVYPHELDVKFKIYLYDRNSWEYSP